MQRLFALSVVTAIMSGSVSAQPGCPSKVGDVVEFQSGANLFDQLDLAALEKGEFETSLAFAERLAAARSSMNLSEPRLVRVIFDNEYIEYDADAEEFYVKTYAWSNQIASAEDVFPRGNEYGIEVSLLGHFGVVMEREETVTGTYEASNALGATATITQSTRQTYAVFDQGYDTGGAISGRPDTWDAPKVDGRGPGIVRVAVPISDAPAAKDGMQAGVWITPKEPYAASGVYRNTPNMRNRREVTAITNMVVADMMCTVIADQNGTVLSTVAIAY